MPRASGQKGPSMTADAVAMRARRQAKLEEAKLKRRQYNAKSYAKRKAANAAKKKQAEAKLPASVLRRREQSRLGQQRRRAKLRAAVAQVCDGHWQLAVAYVLFKVKSTMRSMCCDSAHWPA